MTTRHARPKVGRKVKAATIASMAASTALAFLNQAIGNNAILGTLPGWLQSVLLICGPTLVTFLSGYLTKHAPPIEPEDPAN